MSKNKAAQAVAEHREHGTPVSHKDKSDFGKLGSKHGASAGGKARAESLSPAERSNIARQGGKARHGK